MEIDDPGNLVRIPAFKQWELNSWYETPLPELGDQPPRAYLKDKAWSEQRRIGLIVLRKIGALKP